MARGLDTLDYPQEGIEALSIQYSIPTWILRLWEKSYGEEVTRTMAADFLKERPVTIRCCQNKVTPEQLKKGTGTGRGNCAGASLSAVRLFHQRI